MTQPSAATNSSETTDSLPNPAQLKALLPENNRVRTDTELIGACPDLQALRQVLQNQGMYWHYRHEIPDHIEQDSRLGPYAFRLYGHYQRVGRCFESVRTTASRTQISAGKVTSARGKLEEAGYIQCRRPSRSGPYHVLACDQSISSGDAQMLEEAGIEPPQGGYTQVPNIADEQLAPGPYRVYVHLLRRTGGGGTCYLTNTAIADSTDLSRRSVGRALQALADKGYISRRDESGIRVHSCWLHNWLRYATQSSDRLEKRLATLSGERADMNETGTDEQQRAHMKQRTTSTKNTPVRSENARAGENPSTPPSTRRLHQFVQQRSSHRSQFGAKAAKKAARKFKAKYASTGWRISGAPIINWQPLFESYLAEWQRRSNQSSPTAGRDSDVSTGWMPADEVNRHARERGLAARGPAYKHNGKTGSEARWKYMPE